jgi:tRNA/tmRNA/rRNA uracil-C5-methylase (TrmA/RlmC/RlmD family)
MPGIAPTAHQALNALARAHGLPDVPVISGQATGFRHRSRLAIRGRMGSPKIGMFELGTHHVVHIPSCLVHHPLINEVAGIVRRALVDARVPSYSESAHLGLARYLQVVVERSSQTAQLVLVGNSPTAEPLAACLDLVRERLGSSLHSLWFNANTGTTNTILGPDFELKHGPESVVEHFGGCAVHYPPGAFGQSNLDVAQDIIAHVRREIPAGARVMELYAGIGAIGLSVLDAAGTLILNELAPQSLRGLEMGLAGLPATQRAKVSVIAGPATAEESLVAAAEADVIIADPPRKGLDSELLELLIRQPPERFLYVSCGLESFLEETQRLLAAGELRLSALTAFNLMPYTEHVETLARFERV